MSRLLKKCFFLSVGLHVLLVAVLILGAAFLVTQPEKVAPVLSMIAPKILDDLLSPSTPPQTKPNINQPSATRPQARLEVKSIPPRHPGASTKDDPGACLFLFWKNEDIFKEKHFHFRINPEIFKNDVDFSGKAYI